MRIKAEIFPHRESLDVNGYLTELSRLDFIVRYQYGGCGYIFVKNFLKHQSPHHTEKRGTYPLPTAPDSVICGLTVKEPLTHGCQTVNIPLIPDSLFLIPDSVQALPSPPAVDVPKKQKGKPCHVLGDYPAELHEAISIWRNLLKSLRSEEIVSKFKEGTKYLQKYPGTPEAIFTAWKKRTEAKARGRKITNTDILEAIKIMGTDKWNLAEQGESLSAPQLPSLINSDKFVECILIAIDSQVEA